MKLPTSLRWLAAALAPAVAVMVGPVARADQFPAWTATIERELATADLWVDPWRRSFDVAAGNDAFVYGHDSNGAFVRRFDAAGHVRATTRIGTQALGLDAGSRAGALVRADGAGGAYAWLGGQPQCVLLRASVGGELAFRVEPLPDPYPSECSGLVVLPGGDALVLQFDGMARVRPDGSVAWRVVNGSPGVGYFWASSFTLAPDGTIWVAGRANNAAKVERFDLDGTRLGADQFLCPECIYNEARAVVVVPGGDVVVIGNGQRAFVARYSPAGVRRYLNFIGEQPRILEGVVDGRGRIYVRNENDEVLGVDADTGAIAWQHPGRSLTPLPDGVLVAERLGYGDETPKLVAYAADGATRWVATPFPADTSFGGAMSDANGITLLLQRNRPDASCGRSPSLVRLGLDGSVVSERQACRSPTTTYVRGLAARVGVGALIDDFGGLRLYTPSGATAWSLQVCDGCSFAVAGAPHRTPAYLRGDGGAWALRGDFAGTWPVQPTVLERIDAQGIVRMSTALPPAGAAPSTYRLLAGDADAWVIVTGNGSVAWQRYDDSGATLAAGALALPEPMVEIDGVKRLADGGFALAAQSAIDFGCFSKCFPIQSTAFRIDASGNLRWRYDAPSPNTAIQVAGDGSAANVAYLAPDGSSLVRIDAQGNVAAPVVLPGVFPDYYAPLLLLPNRLFASGIPGSWSVAPDGTGLVARTGFVELLDGNADGILVRNGDELQADAEWRDATTLATLERYDLPRTPGDAGYDPTGIWTVLADGTVYGAKQVLGNDGIMRGTLARFTLPGAQPDVSFVDGFESAP